MRIKQKLILGFVGVVLALGIVEVVCINIGQKILQVSIRENSGGLTIKATEKIDELRNIALSITAGLTASGIVFGILIFKHAWKPLLQLRAAMSGIADGNLDTRVDIKRNDEIGELANAFNDMAERLKQAQEALDVSQGKFNAMLGAISDDIALIDKNLNIIWTNEAAKKIYGDNIVGMKCYQAYHQRTSPCEPYPCPTIKALYNDQIHQYETMVKGQDGQL